MKKIDYQGLDAYIRAGELPSLRAEIKRICKQGLPLKIHTLLDAAVNYGRVTIVDYLLTLKFTSESPEHGYSLALFRELENKTSRLLEKLTSAADLTCRNPEGMTPLIYAAFRENAPAIEVLLTKPTNDINAIDRYGMSALTYCCLNGNEEIANMLLAKNIKIISLGNQHDDIYYAVIKNNANILQLLLAAGVAVNKGQEEFGFSLTVNAAQVANPTVMELLVAHGAELGYIDRLGQTPLLEAAKRYDGWQYALTEIMLKNGADIKIRVPGGGNIESIARHKNDVKLLEIIKKHQATPAAGPVAQKEATAEPEKAPSQQATRPGKTR